MIINAENMVLGRLSSFIAKKALLGEKVDVVNADKAVIIGSKKVILKKYNRKRNLGEAHDKAIFPRAAERLVRRTIRGMLPYKHYKGKEAFKRVRCYIGVPEKFANETLEIVNEARLKEHHMKFMKVNDLSKLLGAK